MQNLQVTIDGQSGTIQDSGMVKFGSDDRVNVLFYKRSVHDPAESKTRGRPWSKAVDYVRIQQPGEKDYVDRPVAEDDTAKFRWPRHWAAYQQGQKPAPNGSPVEILFPQSPEIAANLHGLGVHTIEQLAGLTEHGAQTVGMGATMWRNKAKEFLAAANGGVGMHRLQQQLEAEKNKNEVMANQISLMKTQLDRLMAQQDQKIPSAMIPTSEPTLAQSTFRAQPMSFSNDGPADTDASEVYAAEDPYAADAPISNEPLFIEAGAELADASDDHGAGMIGSDAPKKSGWPKGKPRGSRASQEG